MATDFDTLTTRVLRSYPQSADRSEERRQCWYFYTKRTVDVLICLFTLPISLSVIGMVALLVLVVDGRPIFLIQPRTGLGGHRFRLFKFRTMVRNAAEIREQLLHLNELSLPDFKITNDPRITRLGRFLRKTSLDELPQILNVLQGDMSLVGPRPTSFDGDTYELWQTERLEALPGITGLWQIRGRANIDFCERAKLDIEYIRNRSLMLDASILVSTIPAVLLRRGAS